MAVPASSLFEAVPTLRESIEKLGRLIREPSDLDQKELPDLDGLINDWYDENVDVTDEAFARRILAVFQNSPHRTVYNSFVDQIPPEQKDVIDAFVSGKLTAEEAGKSFAEELRSVDSLETNVHSKTVRSWWSSLKATATGERKLIANQDNDIEFRNWGRTVKQTPAITCYPQTVEEIQIIVREAVRTNKGVRVSGFRHSWAPVFGRDDKQGRRNNGDILISTLTKKNATELPNFTALPSSLFQAKPTELNRISVVDAAYVNGPTLEHGKKYVRVGTATTNEQFRRWCINEGYVTLPMNIIEVEITMGGSNATICHGAGINNSTLSDRVRCIEYVDVHAELRKVDMADQNLLRAASGCFGLLGVVTHITLECDAMVTAVMRPMKMDVVDAIPPPPEMKESDIPMPLRKQRSEKQKQDSQQKFEHRANNDFYAEWFWFPFSDQVWVNTWTTDASTSNVVDYPDYAKVFLQVVGTIFMNVAQIMMQKIGALQLQPQLQTAFLSWLAMKNLDERQESEPPIRTLLPNALHYQRGVTNIRVRNLEVELPLHAKKGSSSDRDYSNVQRAFWDAIIACYANVKTCPMRMPIEMRITGSSNVVMAPQRTHRLGTCAIGILTLHAVADLWEPFAQQVLNKWTHYTDNEGNRLITKPHWAKEWDRLKVDGKPWREKLKNEVYKNEIAEFKELLTAIGKKQDWTLADLRRTFSNDVLDYLFFNGVEPTDQVGRQAQKPPLLDKMKRWLHSNGCV